MILYWIKPQTIDIHVYLDILITRGASSWSRKTSFTMATWNKQLNVTVSWCHFRHLPLSLKTHLFSGRTPHTQKYMEYLILYSCLSLPRGTIAIENIFVLRKNTTHTQIYGIINSIFLFVSTQSVFLDRLSISRRC